MASRTVIHIGLPKTGTTYLQTAMWSHREELREQGWLYPGADRMHHFHLARSVAGDRGEKSVRLHRELVAAARDWDGTALLSHEFLCRATAAQASALLDELGPTEVTVVVTARDYERQFAAVWQEALKMGNAPGLGAFMDRLLAPGHQQDVRRAHEQDSVSGSGLRQAWGWSTQDLAAVMQRWTAAAGIDRVRLVTVPQPGAPRTLLWDRWCAVSGLDASDLDLRAATANESLGAVQAALLTHVVPRLTDDLGDAPVRHRWLRQYLGHTVLVPQGGERIGLAERHATLLADLTDDLLAELRAAAYNVEGDLVELRPAPRPGLRDPDTVSEGEALASAAEAIEQMVRDVRDTTYRMREARAEARAARESAVAPLPLASVPGRLVARVRRGRAGTEGQR